MQAMEQAIAKTLMSIPEVELTRRVVIPLLKVLGSTQVEYNHGVGEYGKDINCWRIDEIGEPELTVAQVKHYKPSKRPSDSNAFQTAVNQLIDASTRELPYQNRSVHTPIRGRTMVTSRYRVNC